MPIRWLDVTGLFLFAASWLVVEHFNPWRSFHSEFVAFLAIFVLVLERYIRSATKLDLPVICVATLAVSAIPWVQWASGLGYFAGDAILSTLYLDGFAFAIFVGFIFAKPADSSRFNLAAVMLSFAVAAMLSAGVAWFQWFSVEWVAPEMIFPSDVGRAIGNLAQPNHLAILLLIGLVAFTYLYYQKALGTAGFSFGVVFLSIALAMTQSRAGLMIAVIIALYLGMKRSVAVSRLALFLLSLWVAMTFAIFRVLPYLSDALLLTASATQRSMGDTSGRWEIWRQMLDAINKSPWWGYGWNQTFTGQTVGALDYPGEQNYTYAHNGILDLLVWNGIPLGLLIVIAIGYWLISRMVRVNSVHGVFAMLALLPVAVHSLVEFPFAYANFLFAAGIMAGVVEASIPRTRTWRVRKAWIGLLLSAWIFIGLWVVYEYVKIEEDYRIVRFENLRIGTTPASYVVPEIFLMSHMSALLKGARMPVGPGMAPDQIELLRKVAWRFPYGLLSYKYALALALNGDAGAASRQMAVLRGVFGEQYYKESKAAFRKLETEKYPQLGMVATP